MIRTGSLGLLASLALTPVARGPNHLDHVRSRKDDFEAIDDSYGEVESKRRAEAAIMKMLAAPPKPFTPKAKKKPSPKKRKAKMG